MALSLRPSSSRAPAVCERPLWPVALLPSDPHVDPNTPIKDAQWRYALDADAGRRDGGIKVEHKPMPAHWDWPLDAPVVLMVPARDFAWNPTDAQALPDKPVSGTTSETIRLVPYGCTKFRISMFPVTPRAWQGKTPGGKESSAPTAKSSGIGQQWGELLDLIEQFYLPPLANPAGADSVQPGSTSMPKGTYRRPGGTIPI